jgi:hypothetical protein
MLLQDARKRTAVRPRWPLLTLTIGLMLLGATSIGGLYAPAARSQVAAMPRISVRGDQLYAGPTPFRAWGMNWGVGNHNPVLAYFDHPSSANFATLETELRVARQMGANSMRVPLELGQVMASPTQPRQATLSALKQLLQLAQSQRIYLDITGNIVWRPSHSPAWYEQMPWRARWQVQARFWRAVANTAWTSPAVLCYELTSEPTISQTPGYYYGEIGDFYFVQSIATAPPSQQPALARQWTQLMARSVRSFDDRPVTIGLLPQNSGPFGPANIGGYLDMLSVHEYPTASNLADSIALIQAFAAYRKPVLLGETFLLFCDETTHKAFLTGASPYLAGIFEFFNGKDPRTLRPHTIAEALYKVSLQDFIAFRHQFLGAADGNRSSEPVTAARAATRPFSDCRNDRDAVLTPGRCFAGLRQRAGR